MSPNSTTVVDIHTHIYPASFVTLLRSRTTVPYIYDPPSGAAPRLIILPSDDEPDRPKGLRGRPLDPSYSSWDLKRSFMQLHDINISVVSLANPWLDFLEEPAEAVAWAKRVNDDLESTCSESNARDHAGQTLRLFAFAVLPLKAHASAIADEIQRIKGLKHFKGVIMGTTGLGTGLDDPDLEPVWAALQKNGMLVFLHPHYGLDVKDFGGKDVVARSGHVLPLAIGFPIETTIAVARMFLAGVFDRHEGLQMLLAHSGGTLPFLAGRIESCVNHEREFKQNGGPTQGPVRSIWDILKTNIYLDAVIYGEVGLKAAIDATKSTDRVLFGTDHPFFPPLNAESEAWPSVTTNYAAIAESVGENTDEATAILGGNALRILGIAI